MNEDVLIAAEVLERTDPDWREYIDGTTLNIGSVDDCLFSQIGRKKHGRNWDSDDPEVLPPYSFMLARVRAAALNDEEDNAVIDATCSNRDDVLESWLQLIS